MVNNFISPWSKNEETLQVLVQAARGGHTWITAVKVHSCPRSVPVALFCFPPIVFIFGLLFYAMMMEIQSSHGGVKFILCIKSNLRV